MTDWRDILRDGRDEPMSPDRVQAIRRLVVDTARRAQQRSINWSWRVALASAAAVLLLAGGGDRAPVTNMGTPETATDPGASGERRRLQFATPGGTRIIWELNPDFKLMETLP